MMQVVDRRSQAGPSSTMVTVPSPITSPKKASNLHQSPRTPLASDIRASSSSKSNSLWSSNVEDNALARTQQFIIDTHKNPIQFKLSEAPISAEVPYPPINDGNLISEENKLSTPSGKAINKSEIAMGTSPKVYTTTTPRVELGEGGSRMKVESPVNPLKDLCTLRISLRPPKEAAEKGVGLQNKGNTCYMNSTLQALLHLPPLSHALLTFDANQLYGRFGGTPLQKFDAIGEMVSLAERVLTTKSRGMSQTPTSFISSLKSYARTLSKFCQEDAHEFLRFLLEAMQYCCVLRAPKSLKPNDPLRETTLIHKIFGGKLRSRVQCQRCKHNSDTFDPILDLSLDLRKSNSVTEALEKFTSVDVLTGSEKYRCEKCKKPVEATKGFTIHEPPLVLNIHLKRFTLSGQKINRQIHYPESLVLSRHMLSEGVAPQHYQLRSIIHHHGSSPNSGHYVATVKGNKGNRWYEMNDSSVHPVRGTPVNMHDAYILFYVRDPDHALTTAVGSESLLSTKGRFSIETGAREKEERGFNNQRREDSSPSFTPLKRQMASSPSMQQQQSKKQFTTIEPSNFYAKPSSSMTTIKASNTFQQKSPMFRNMEMADSDDEDQGDDVGEAIESLGIHRHQTPSSIRPANGVFNKKKKKKSHHRDNLGLGIRAGNQQKSKSSFSQSPFRAGHNTLSNKPLHSRMKDRHGNRH